MKKSQEVETLLGLIKLSRKVAYKQSEDLTLEEIWDSIVETLVDLQDKENFRIESHESYLKKSAINKIKDKKKSKKTAKRKINNKTQSLDCLLDNGFDVESNTISPDKELCTLRETAERVLNDDEKSVLYMIADGKKKAKIERELGFSQSKVRHLLKKAKAKMKLAIIEEDGINLEIKNFQ
jgi:DNA-binding CsgD family transcriptional regulator